MNFILTASAIIFPLITFPYISRVLGAVGNGKVAFAASVVTYFAMFASLGIPTYGIRACAKVRDDREELSRTVQELLIINAVTTAVTFGVFLVTLVGIPKFAAQKELLLINSVTLLLNMIGVTWLYTALEQYAYITLRTLLFKVLSIVMMFAVVRHPEDYMVYGAISVFAGGGSNVLNFLNLRRYVSLKKTGAYHFREHVKPILIFFSTSAAISVYTNLDVVMLGFLKTDADVGYYNAAIKVKVLLVSLITSLGTVLLPRLSYYIEKNQKEEFHRIIGKAFQFVFVLAASVMVYFMLFAEESILFLAGTGFEGAVLPMIFLMPTVLFIGLSNVTGIQMLTPMGQEKKVLYSILCGAVIDFLLNLWLIPKTGASGAAFATMVAELAVVAVQALYLRDSLGTILKNAGIRKVLVATAGAGIVAWGIKQLPVPSVFLMLVVSAVGYFGIYGILLLVQKESFTCGILGNGVEWWRSRRRGK